MRVENIENRDGRKVVNQFVLYDGNKVVFQSYESTIIEVDMAEKTIKVGADYNYSRTTSKYRNMFFEDYTRFKGLATLKGLEKAIKDGNFDGYTVEMF